MAVGNLVIPVRTSVEAGTKELDRLVDNLKERVYWELDERVDGTCAWFKLHGRKVVIFLVPSTGTWTLTYTLPTGEQVIREDFGAASSAAAYAVMYSH